MSNAADSVPPSSCVQRNCLHTALRWGFFFWDRGDVAQLILADPGGALLSANHADVSAVTLPRRKIENLFAASALLRLNFPPSILPGPMECGLGNPARAGRQQRYFALHPPWSPWHFYFSTGTTENSPGCAVRRRRAAGSGQRVSRFAPPIDEVANCIERISWLIRSLPENIVRSALLMWSDRSTSPRRWPTRSSKSASPTPISSAARAARAKR